ncbi:hypothetical protein CHS0354_040042 [Potamilus streckersoni]|uniref:Uncharacterized protein n=1 Tax=Potamilus streckersoni TaxID=2493646 RepID=A0AAE0STA5_9BIVA|nr:hypothetical protein CHS0354_040042 [Potamilus streckersoni]
MNRDTYVCIGNCTILYQTADSKYLEIVDELHLAINMSSDNKTKQSWQTLIVCDIDLETGYKTLVFYYDSTHMIYPWYLLTAMLLVQVFSEDLAPMSYS